MRPASPWSGTGGTLGLRVSPPADQRPDRDEPGAPVDPLIGRLVTGRYRVHRRIGEGGMGTVYAAEHEAIEKRVALKVLHREYSANPDVLDRFKQEAISASRIKHPNVIDVFDFGQLEDGSCFIAMEFLEGQDLGDALSKVGAFDPEEAIRIALQICRALGLAHSRGVVHRDLKPENVFLQNTPEGEQVVKIVDFGIAQLRPPDEVAEGQKRQRRLTKTGMIFGTPEYMAPEQARGQNVDQRADVYATGCILYELLSGSVPFIGESFLDVLNKHVMAPVPSLRSQPHAGPVSEELEQVVLMALAKEASERFASMRDFAQAMLRTPEGRAVRSHSSSSNSLGPSLLPPPPITPDDAPQMRAPRVPAGFGHDGLVTEDPPTPESGHSSHPSESRTAILGSGSGRRGGTSVPGVLTTRDAADQAERPRGLWIASGIAMAVAAVVVVWFVLRPHSAERSVVTPAVAGDAALKDVASGDGSSSAAASPSVGSLVPSAGSSGAPTPPELPSAAPSSLPDAGKVVLHVRSIPTGAVIEKDGFQVCDASPCDVTVDRGAAVTLSAKRGSASGTKKVLAEAEQVVTIGMVSATAAPKASSSGASGERLCEVNVDGLKILRPCGN